jgi:hypothetical protein
MGNRFKAALLHLSPENLSGKVARFASLFILVSPMKARGI